MKKKQVYFLMCILTVLIAATTLTRCGSGSGESIKANANGMKF